MARFNKQMKAKTDTAQVREDGHDDAEIHSPRPPGEPDDQDDDDDDHHPAHTAARTVLTGRGAARQVPDTNKHVHIHTHRCSLPLLCMLAGAALLLRRRPSRGECV
eukprot:1150751-Pelagomonas_calceolata.AAC.4